MDFNELYWSIKVLDILGEYNIIFTLKDKLINTYEKDKITYKKNKNFIIIQSMYQEMNYIFNKKTDNKEVLKGIKALEDNLVNYDDEFFIECTNNYLNLIYNLKIKVDKSTIQKIHNKLLSYKTLYGYSNNKRFKSFNLKSTFEGYESEYLIKRIKGGN
ncbi:hypothetical protein IRP62_13320 (plasmid) [Clostridium botulinum]|nr:hypothetical protein [Clostridium botulinum]EGO88330.1 hypothetical protein CBCST_06208 [Clostridium botulinum C str. Stockholm]QPW54684.1 hypothetical protein IRP62_13320 [Clostridium botulinum]